MLKRRGFKSSSLQGRRSLQTCLTSFHQVQIFSLHYLQYFHKYFLSKFFFSFDKNDFSFSKNRSRNDFFFFLTLFARYDNINCGHLSNNSIIRKGPPEPCGGLKHLWRNVDIEIDEMNLFQKIQQAPLTRLSTFPDYPWNTPSCSHTWTRALVDEKSGYHL